MADSGLAEIEAIRFYDRQHTQFRPQPNLRPQQVRTQTRPQQSHGQFNVGRYGYQDRPQIKCVYCNKMGHNAEECQKRLADKAPCISSKGFTYYPERRQNRSQPFKNQHNQSNQHNNQGLYNIEDEDFLIWV